jgi:urease subunit gamma/beta
MQLTPAEHDRLLIFTVAELARARRARGLRLNVPEATALVADAVCEAARDGARHAEAVRAGQRLLGPDDVLPGVADVVREVKVEALFEDGTRLVVVPDPVAGRVPGASGPGAIVPAADPEADRTTDADRAPARGAVTVEVRNTAPVPITVTSHFHFLEVNPRLAFDRAAAYGRHLDVPAGSTVRFPPGGVVTVQLVPIAGARVVVGMAGLVDGPLDAPGAREAALELLRETGFLDTGVAGTGSVSGPVGPASIDVPAADEAVGRMRALLRERPQVQQ